MISLFLKQNNSVITYAILENARKSRNSSQPGVRVGSPLVNSSGSFTTKEDETDRSRSIFGNNRTGLKHVSLLPGFPRPWWCRLSRDFLLGINDHQMQFLHVNLGDKKR